MKTSVENIDFKVFNLKNLAGGPKEKKIEKSKIRPHLLEQDQTDNLRILQRCNDQWNALQDFRDRRERARKYLRGDQWSDRINDPENDGEVITEENYIKSQGKIPFKQNIIRQLIKNVIGQYRSNPSKSIVVTRNREDQTQGEVMTQVLRAAKDFNRCEKLDARNWEEFLLSGGAIQKVGFKHWHDRDAEELFLENVNLARMFFNTDVADVRLNDLNLVGEVRDVDLADIISAFASNIAEANLIKSWYERDEGDTNDIVSHEGLTPDRIESLDFLIGSDDKSRLIEVWELRSEFRVYYHDYMSGKVGFTDLSLNEVNQVNQSRILKAAEQGIPQEEVPLVDAWHKLDRFWYVKFLTPYGNCLYKGETPYEHKSHPYSMLLYPMLDGEVWGLVEDIIDQQRYINRLITLMDFIMGASAKGVLFVHEDNIPADMTIDDFSAEWTKFNGVIRYKAKPGIPQPKQISTNSTNIGLMDMLSLQMKLVQDIAGVSGAIQGQTAKSGTPSSLYAQEAQNSSLNVRDYMDEFLEFKRDRDTKSLKVLVQFYNEEKNISVPGDRRTFVKYNPEDVNNLDFEVVVAQASDTPVYRQLVDDQLFKLFESGMIDLKMYLSNSSLPFADKLLNDINSRQQEQVEGQGQINPEMIQGIAEAQKQVPEGNPQTQEIINTLMAGQQG